MSKPVSIRVLVGTAQEPQVVPTAAGQVPGFNPCIGRNSSGAIRAVLRLLRFGCVSIRVLVGTAQEHAKSTTSAN